MDRWRAGVAFALLTSGACAPQSAVDATAPWGSTGARASSSSSILSGSTPAPGSVVAGPLDQLVLRFSPPARLHEVTVSGPEGMMPMMITPVGEVPSYTLPLSGLGAGIYTVNWRATAGGQIHQGSFGFTVR